MKSPVFTAPESEAAFNIIPLLKKLLHTSYSTVITNLLPPVSSTLMTLFYLSVSVALHVYHDKLAHFHIYTTTTPCIPKLPTQNCCHEQKPKLKCKSYIKDDRTTIPLPDYAIILHHPQGYSRLQLTHLLPLLSLSLQFSHTRRLAYRQEHTNLYSSSPRQLATCYLAQVQAHPKMTSTWSGSASYTKVEQVSESACRPPTHRR